MNTQILRRPTHQVQIDHVSVGSDSPVIVQSMTNTDTADAQATALQVKELSEAGSEMVRITVNNPESAAKVAEIRQGDYLLRYNGEENAFNMMPHAPSQHIDAKVVSIFDGISEAGQFQTITLNKGSAHGLEKGTVLSIYKRSRQVKMDMQKGKDGSRSVVKYLSIPAEEAGLAMVYRVSQNLASAIILESKTNISIGDTASEPGQDLDNMLDDGRHEPNVPQDPHDDEHNTTNILSNIH